MPIQIIQVTWCKAELNHTVIKLINEYRCLKTNGILCLIHIINKKVSEIEEQIKVISCDAGLNSGAVKLFEQYKGIEELD